MQFGRDGGDSLGDLNFIVASSCVIVGGESDGDFPLIGCFMAITGKIQLLFFKAVGGEPVRWLGFPVPGVLLGDFGGQGLLAEIGGNGGGDSIGDRIFIAASSRVRGNAGEGDLLETGDCIVDKRIGDFDGDFSFTGETIF